MQTKVFKFVSTKNHVGEMDEFPQYQWENLFLDTINVFRFLEATGYEPYISGLQKWKNRLSSLIGFLLILLDRAKHSYHLLHW